VRRPVWIHDLAREGTIVAVLYAIWQRIGELSTGSTDKAVSRGLAIHHLTQDLHLPSEHWLQQLALHSHTVVRFFNWYYILGHAPIMGAFLVWLYWRHQPEFARWRTTLAVGSIIGELIQVVPVAPPRLTLHNIVDTGLAYGPHVYDADGQGFAPQLAAMPSLHCVWAITIGIAVWKVAPRRWRWLGPLHAVLTVLGVVITGNHWWMDAIAGGGLVLLGLGLHDGTARLRARRAGHPRAEVTGPAAPAERQLI
jgi:drug/metabolite transporter superfamily protein YnfA